MAASNEFTATVAQKVVERGAPESECLRMYGLAVWVLADAVLEAEEDAETPTTYARACPECGEVKVFTKKQRDELFGPGPPVGWRCEKCLISWKPFR